MIRVAICLGVVVSLAACTSLRNNRLAFDGHYFRATAKSVDGDRREISVSVQPVSASMQGAQAAGRHEATKYCIENYGSSRVDWVIGPDDDPDTYELQGDKLVLRGACTG